MDKIVRASDKEKLKIFRESTTALNIPVAMVEKDFWVCFILSKIFTDKELGKVLRFKGGTSLSKGYGLIKRFSEDLDLILDKTLVLGDENIFKSSYKKQREFTDVMSERAADYISTTLKTKIEAVLGGVLKVYTDAEYINVNPKYRPENIDNKSLHVIYPKVSDDSYLRPDILLEIGIMSAQVPNETREISSYVAQAFPELELQSASVPTIMAKRTFWDKATILHREFYRPEKTHTPARYSRHYYDLYQMGLSSVKADTLADKKLLADVVDRKDKLYHCSWAQYEDCLTGKIHLLPNENNKSILIDDYKSMQGMIYGDPVSWQDILAYLSELEKEINSF